MAGNGVPSWLQDLAGPRRWSEADARRVFAEQEASGESIWQFAARVGLLAQRLYEWRDRLSGREPRSKRRTKALVPVAPTFVPVTIRKAVPQAVHPTVEFAVGDDVRIVVGELTETSARWMATVLRSLRGARS